MPKLTWQCEMCHKLHATCDLAAKCERTHPPGSVICEACDGDGYWRKILDTCSDCDGAGVVVIKEQEHENAKTSDRD